MGLNPIYVYLKLPSKIEGGGRVKGSYDGSQRFNFFLKLPLHFSQITLLSTNYTKI